MADSISTIHAITVVWKFWTSLSKNSYQIFENLYTVVGKLLGKNENKLYIIIYWLIHVFKRLREGLNHIVFVILYTEKVSHITWVN